MMLQSNKFSKVLLVGVAAILLSSILISCGIAEPTSTPIPIASPTFVITETPEPPTPTVETSADEGASTFFLPSPTPEPTLTPGAVSAMISEFTEAQGLQEVTVFQLSVEDWLNLAYSILLILIVGFLLSRLVYYGLTKLTARTQTIYDDQFIRQIRSMIYLIMVTFGFQIGIVRLDLIEAIIKFHVSRLYSLIYVIAGTVIVWRLLDILVEWYRNEVEPERGMQQIDNVLVLLHRGARALLLTISLIMVLSLYNINVTALIAALGVGGLAVSLAAQDTLSNVISGIMIMLDQPFRVSDRIEIPKMNTWGDVVDIGLRSTRIRTRDNRLVIVPNNTISTDQVVNYTYPDPQYRIQFELGVEYGQDIEKVRQVIVDAVRQVEGVLPEKPVDVLYVTMGESAMIFRVRWWINSYRDTRHIFDKVNTVLQREFDEAGIKLAPNTLDINILNMPGGQKDSSMLDSNRNEGESGMERRK